MENQFEDKRNKNGDAVAVMPQHNSIVMPLIALGLDLLLIPIVFLASLGIGVSPFFSFLAVVSPIAGLITGIGALSRGKGQIGAAGKILAITAIALPSSLVIFIIVFFIGAVTGVISLM